MFDHFFIANQPPYPLLWQQHDPWLVTLSILVDIGAAIVALHMAALARRAKSPRQQQLALVSGTLALGAGIWAMHFVGMLAFDLCTRGKFDPAITALSILPGLVASWFSLKILLQPRIGTPRLIGSAVLVAVGIGTMHYLGMEAAAIAPLLRYDPGMFALSLVVAILLAILALWIRFGLKRRRWKNATTPILLAGTTMGVAIAGMHYTGMAAIRLVQPDPTQAADLQAAQLLFMSHANTDSYVLPVAIIAVTTALGLLAIAVNMSLRYREMLAQTLQNELLQRAVLETAVDGVIMINARGIVQSFNPAAEQIFGWQAHEVIGQNINMLMPEPHHSAHDGYLRRHLETGHTSVIGIGRELEGLHKGGHRIPLRLAVGRVEQLEEPLFVGFLVDMTPYKILEQERQRGEAQLRSLVSNLPGVAFRCKQLPGWPMIFVSEAVATVTGWHADDFLQGRINIGQLIHPHDIERVTSEVDRALQQDVSYRVEYRIRTPEGQTRWLVEFGRGLQEDGEKLIDGVMLDITETKMRNAEFEGTVEALDRSEAIAEFNLRGRIIRANENFTRLMGYEANEITGLPHKSLCATKFVQSEAYIDFWKELQAGRFQSGEFQHVGKDGREVWIYATYNPILDADGQVSKIIEFATDLTERRAMEQDLRIAKERAEQAAAARSSFLANMSHEIRTPMNAIIGFTELLLETPLDAAQQRQLCTVHQSAHSMLRLLNDILDTAKLEKGAVTLEIAPFSLRELCKQIRTMLQPGASKKMLELLLDYPPDVPEYWQGDAFRLQQILFNLLGNALKFTGQGHVALRVSSTKDALKLCVEDTGIGMDETAMKRIFAPFAQADASTTRRYGGTGLGTSIARQLAELMGGRITVESQVGQGSTFCVHLPLPPASPESPGLDTNQARPHPAGGSPLKLPPLHVLAVDDVPTNLELLKLVLQRDGHTVICASSGSEALAFLTKEAFDLILMDLQMPEMDGLEATRRIRANEQSQGKTATPVIALSANVMAQDKADAKAAGMDGFASKPLEPSHLMREMARVLKLEVFVPAENGALSEINLAGSKAIDWRRGLQLWPSAVALRAAIGHFLRESGSSLEQLRIAARAEDAPSLLSTAHRIKGAAGNLALPQVAKEAGRIESAARNKDQAAPWPVLIDKLAQMLENVKMETDAQPPAEEPGENHGETNTNTNTATPATCGLICEALEKMKQALARGEFPQDQLCELEKYLPSGQLATLKTTLDSFDFEAAQREAGLLQAQFDKGSESA